MGKPSDLVRGTLDVLILKTIALEPRHGWPIAMRIPQISREVHQVPQGSLYPALPRLEQCGWVKAKWKENRDRPASQVLLIDCRRTHPGRTGSCELEPPFRSNQFVAWRQPK